MPPLRERANDIPELARHFTRRYAQKFDRPIEHIPMATLQVLCNCDWPGNIRELENFIERSVILSSGPTLTPPLAGLDRSRRIGYRAQRLDPSMDSLEDVERAHIVIESMPVRSVYRHGGLITAGILSKRERYARQSIRRAA